MLTSFVFNDSGHAANLFALNEFGNIYSRIMNPTVDVFEKRVATLEGGALGLALASDSAAISIAALNICKSGQNIVSSQSLHGGTHNLFAHTFKDLGIEVRFLFAESIGNPGNDVIDFRAVSKVAENNAILITHALSGDAHVAGTHRVDDQKPGWWDAMVGPGKAFDTDKYFVICSNVLGGCRGSTGPSSSNPATDAPYGVDFPLVTIGDMVRVQKELIASLGIDILLSVAGGSMGGMQALDWAIRFPDALKSVMILASTHLIGAQQIAFDAVGRNAIRADSDFQTGACYGGPGPAKGLSVARMLARIT